jgi:hypothetical protein
MPEHTIDTQNAHKVSFCSNTHAHGRDIMYTPTHLRAALPTVLVLLTSLLRLLTASERALPAAASRHQSRHQTQPGAGGCCRFPPAVTAATNVACGHSDKWTNNVACRHSDKWTNNVACRHSDKWTNNVACRHSDRWTNNVACRHSDRWTNN